MYLQVAYVGDVNLSKIYGLMGGSEFLKMFPCGTQHTTPHTATHTQHSIAHTSSSLILLVLEGRGAGLRLTGLGPVYSQLKVLCG